MEATSLPLDYTAQQDGLDSLVAVQTRGVSPHRGHSGLADDNLFPTSHGNTSRMTKTHPDAAENSLPGCPIGVHYPGRGRKAV